MPGLYPTAYRATFPAFFCVTSSLFLLSVLLFVFSILPRRCPSLATFSSVLFCLLSLLTSDSRFDLVWFHLPCDHGWIRSGSVNVRKTATTTHTHTHLAEPKEIGGPASRWSWVRTTDERAASGNGYHRAHGGPTGGEGCGSTSWNRTAASAISYRRRLMKSS